MKIYFYLSDIFSIICRMSDALFLDRKKYKETFKAQIFYIFVSLYEGMVFSFLTLFLNECRKNLSWSFLMSSFSLFLPPFGAAIGTFISSFLVSSQKKNLKLMRIICLSSFVLINTLGLLGLFLPNGLNGNGLVENSFQYYFLYSIFVIIPFLLMGLHWSFLSFQTSNIADINYAEKTRYGHVCLYGVLVPLLASPIAGLIAESLFHSYKGYLFLFSISSPTILILFGLTYLFKPFDSSIYHQDEHELVSYKDLFKNKTYVFYLLLASIWIPLVWVNDSLSSNFWTALESSNDVLNAFNPLTWGFFIAFSSLMEFVFVFINTKFGFGKKVKFSLTLSFILLFLLSTSFGIISIFYNGPIQDGLGLVLVVIALHSLKGMANGLYLTSNIMMLHSIVGPKYRRKAVFIAPCIYQLVNSILQFVYPYLTSFRYISFFVLSFLALLGFILSFFLNVSISLPHKNVE